MMVFWHSVLEAYFVTTFCTLIGVELSQLSFAFNALAHHQLRNIRHEVSLAVHRFVDAEIIFNGKVIVNVNGLVAERAHIDFFVFLFVLTAVVGLNRRVFSAIDLFAVLTLNREPILLTTRVEGTEFSNVLIEHF
jgi:hypothetical protein